MQVGKAALRSGTQPEERYPTHMDINTLGKLVIYIVLIFGAVIMIMPFAWMASTACKTPAEVSQVPIRWIPENPACLENLRQLYDTSEHFNRYLLNTAIMTIGRTLGQLLFCSLAAYGFARFLQRFRFVPAAAGVLADPHRIGRSGGNRWRQPAAHPLACHLAALDTVIGRLRRDYCASRLE